MDLTLFHLGTCLRERERGYTSTNRHRITLSIPSYLTTDSITVNSIRHAIDMCTQREFVIKNIANSGTSQIVTQVRQSSTLDSCMSNTSPLRSPLLPNSLLRPSESVRATVSMAISCGCKYVYQICACITLSSCGNICSYPSLFM